MYSINPDIKKAETLPRSFYSDIKSFDSSKEAIFARSWQFVCSVDEIRIPGQVYPFTFMEGFIDEPLLLTRDENDTLRCLPNVCTHRGNLLVEHAGTCKNLRCRYHGRKFALDGKFLSMPECQDAENFPRPEDSLSSLPVAVWGPFVFVSLDPVCSFEEWIAPVQERVAWMPVDQFSFDSTTAQDYMVRSHWALYCDNYLEGFHIPYVHPGLNQVVDYGSYSTEVFQYSNLQLGISKGGEGVFELPKESVDFGKDVSAYYFWLFPNIMLNFYPWGVSVNVVRPLQRKQTKVSFLPFVWKSELREEGAGAALDVVEREDEAIVEAVQRGLQSRFYKTGRFSPKREQGVHHFHTLLAEQMSGFL